MPWSLTVLGETFREGDLTIEQAEKIEEECDVTWRLIHPLHSAKIARRMSAVLLADRLGCPLADAYGKLNGLRVDEMLEGVTSYADDLPGSYENGNPQLADEISTDT